MYDEKQKLQGGVAVFRDITGHKQVERRLARDALMLANVRDAIIFTDKEGIVIYWNEGATRLFGLNASEILGRSYSDRYAEPERSAVIEMMQTIAVQGEWSGEWRDRRQDGAGDLDRAARDAHQRLARPVFRLDGYFSRYHPAKKCRNRTRSSLTAAPSTD